MPEDGVSVIIATLNGGAHVGAALASIRVQTRQPDEVIVVDVGSTDDTIEQLTHIANRYPRLRILEVHDRLTAPQARNLALAEVSSHFVATLDQDDLMAPDRLAVQLAGLAANPGAVAIASRLVSVDFTGAPQRRGTTADRTPHGAPTSREQFRWALTRYSPAVSSGVAYRTGRLRSLGGFDEQHPLTDDYALLARLIDQGTVEADDTVVGSYRRHEAMTSVLEQRSLFHQTRLLQWRLIHERLGSRPALTTVNALVRPDQPCDIDDLYQARALWCALYDETRERPQLSDADRTWILADFSQLLGRFDHRLSATETTPATNPHTSPREPLPDIDPGQAVGG